MSTVPLHRARSTSSRYGVATISRLLKIVGLFRKRALQKRRYSAKETYRSHPIDLRSCQASLLSVYCLVVCVLSICALSICAWSICVLSRVICVLSSYLCIVCVLSSYLCIVYLYYLLVSR